MEEHIIWPLPAGLLRHSKSAQLKRKTKVLYCVVKGSGKKTILPATFCNFSKRNPSAIPSSQQEETFNMLVPLHAGNILKAHPAKALWRLKALGNKCSELGSQLADTLLPRHQKTDPVNPGPWWWVCIISRPLPAPVTDTTTSCTQPHLLGLNFFPAYISQYSLISPLLIGLIDLLKFHCTTNILR